MAKDYRTFEHTADVGLQASADTLGELFEALATGLARYIASSNHIAGAESRHVTVKAEDVEALAVDYLTEILHLIQTDHFMIASANVPVVNEHSVQAELLGEPYDPTRHVLDHEVKAVTYHQLKVAREENGRWVARLILDI